jgi:type II secretion system protein N
MPMPSDWVEGLVNRRLLLYGLYTGVLFIIFLIANFPYDEIVQRFVKSVDLSEQGLRLQVGGGRFAWWRGYELQRVRIMSTDGAADALPLFEASSIYVRPGFDGLLRGQINSVNVLGSLYGGQVDGMLAMGEGMRRVMITIDGLQLHRYPTIASLLQLQDGAVAGELSGVVTIEAHGTDVAETRAEAALDLDKASLTDATLTNGLTLPALHFDKAAMKLSLQGGRVELQELDANGPELRLSANGQIALRQPVSDSVLNLKLTALPGADSPEEVRTLLSLLPQPAKGAKPDTPRTITGTIARPRIR